MLFLVIEPIRLPKKHNWITYKSYILHFDLKLDASTKFHKYSQCSPEMSSKMTHLHFTLISDHTIQERLVLSHGGLLVRHVQI